MSSIEDLRSLQIDSDPNDPMSTLRMVEINPIEICNRVCDFCPRSMPDLYPNRPNQTSNALIEKIANDLDDFNFNGRVGFVGFGEPTLHKKLVQQIEILSRVKSISFIEVNTNGDFLTEKMVADLASAGTTHLTVSMYDRDITEDLKKLVKDTAITLVPRHCYPEKFELKIVNRNSMLEGIPNKAVKRNCYIPFYKMFIDWNGQVLTCSEDWGRESNLGNVFESSVKEIWLGKAIEHYRKNLGCGNRQDCKPCQGCDINGTLWGETQYRYFDKYYKDRI